MYIKYEKISNDSSRYIITCYLLIAIILNICFGFLAIISDIVFEVKFKLTLNFIFLTINIFLYIWAFLISTILIKNYKFTVTNKKIEVISGAIIISRKIMLVNRVYKIEIKRGIIGRIFKVASVRFYSSGGCVNLKYVDYSMTYDIEQTVKKGMKAIYGR